MSSCKRLSLILKLLIYVSYNLKYSIISERISVCCFSEAIVTAFTLLSMTLIRLSIPVSLNS